MEADFSGYATKAGLKCTDGRTIMPDAFKHMDGLSVPLVWQHGHNEPANVLGHAVLEAKEGSVYAYAFLNKTPNGETARSLVEHGDVTMMSIYANQLVEKAKQVMHGMIREVSLVIAGANPGALIDNITIRHADGEYVDLDDEAIIYTGLPLELMHEDAQDEEEETPEPDPVVEQEPEVENEEPVEHAEKEQSMADKTVEDVYNSLTDEQKDLLHFMVGAAMEEAKGTAAQSAIDYMEGNGAMSHNVFEQDEEKNTLSHAELTAIVNDAKKGGGSLKEAFAHYALQHGIDDIDVLFPEARTLSTGPEWIKRRTEWVKDVLGGTRKSPFSRVKTLSADLTYEEARARGYIKGNLKKEEFFAVAKRTTTPATIYKKQKLDRDDIIDITDMDVVAWLKGEMRIMLDEEIARAILVGDGRDVASDDKIPETNIRPIAKDDDFYKVTVPVNLDDPGVTASDVVDAAILARQYYKGSGLPTFFTTESFIGQLMVLRDADGHRLYRNLSEIAAEMRVQNIVPVEVLEESPEIIGIVVNMNDYVVGADRGGEVSLFDDFDIDYNQYKYLIETRISGALVKAKSAMVIVKSALTTVLAEVPGYDIDTYTVTIPSVTGVVYEDGDGATLLAGDTVLGSGEVLTVVATADTGYILEPSAKTKWVFRNRA